VRFGRKQMKMGLVFLAIMVVSVLLAACGSSGSHSGDHSPNASAGSSQPGEQSASDRVIQDAMGHHVTIPANPQRIIASYLEDPLVALGVKPVAQWSVADGKTVQGYLQSELKGVPTISYNLPPEEVASFNPDLIVIGSPSSVQNGLYEAYSKIAPTYVLGDEINSDWRKTLLKMGELLDKKNEAEQLLKQYDQKAEALKAKLHQTIGDQSVAILWLTQKQFYVVDKTRSSGSVLYGDLGIKVPQYLSDLPSNSQATWSPVSLEKLAQLDADHIFLVKSDTEQTSEIFNNPIWKNLPAVKKGHVYEMSSDSSWLYSGLLAGQQVMEDVSKILANK
jgi:iron complex transport system substrate-binding protein